MEPLDSDRLDSWKEIAAFISRDERTAMRWAKFQGMPVHHAPGGSHARVFAYRSEVLAWVQLQDHPDRPTEHSVPATSGHAGPPARPQQQFLRRDAVPLDESLSITKSAPTELDPFSCLKTRKWLVIGGLTALMSLLLLGELFLLH
jgi:hypothetical protein